MKTEKLVGALACVPMSEIHKDITPTAYEETINTLTTPKNTNDELAFIPDYSINKYESGNTFTQPRINPDVMNLFYDRCVPGTPNVISVEIENADTMHSFGCVDYHEAAINCAPHVLGALSVEELDFNTCRLGSKQAKHLYGARVQYILSYTMSIIAEKVGLRDAHAIEEMVNCVYNELCVDSFECINHFVNGFRYNDSPFIDLNNIGMTIDAMTPCICANLFNIVLKYLGYNPGIVSSATSTIYMDGSMLVRNALIQIFTEFLYVYRPASLHGCYWHESGDNKFLLDSDYVHGSDPDGLLVYDNDEQKYDFVPNTELFDEEEIPEGAKIEE